MEVAYLSSFASKIDWRAKPMLLPQDLDRPTRYYARI